MQGSVVVPAVNGSPGEAKAWWRWVEEHVRAQIDYASEALMEAAGQALGMKAAELRRTFTAEIDLIKRELSVLRQEIAAVKGLRELNAEIAAARTEVPKTPDIVAAFELKQAALEAEVSCLRKELASTKDKLANARVDIGQVEFGLRRLESKPAKPVAEVLAEIAVFLEAEEKATCRRRRSPATSSTRSC